MNILFYCCAKHPRPKIIKKKSYNVHRTIVCSGYLAGMTPWSLCYTEKSPTINDDHLQKIKLNVATEGFGVRN